jgi:hypothetical protein
MTWRAHLVWREPAAPGTYPLKLDGTPVLLDYAETLAGFDSREAAYEAGRVVRRRLEQRGALECEITMTEKPVGRP